MGADRIEDGWEQGMGRVIKGTYPERLAYCIIPMAPGRPPKYERDALLTSVGLNLLNVSA
jgi:hypothetical protein